MSEVRGACQSGRVWTVVQLISRKSGVAGGYTRESDARESLQLSVSGVVGQDEE